MKALAYASLALALAACGDSSTAQAPAPKAAEPSSASQGASRPQSLPDFTALVKKQGPAVVNVLTTRAAPRGGGGAQVPPDDPFYEFFRRFMPDLPDGAPQPGPGQGIGSGFIISEDGYILTNAHVVAGAKEVTVRLADAKREFKAKVVGADERTDVAVLKVDANGLPVAKLGKSKSVQPGEWVAAIGSPFGFSNTITAGIVSATERALPAETYVPFIQTDVAVNPGNSGGPLLNLDGEVIGVNSMIYSRTGGYMGVSFAIPIETALEVAKQLRETGKVTRGRLGVAIQPLTRELAQSFKLDTTDGVVVANVEPDSPAAKAGLQAGDVILSYNGKALSDANNLPRLVGTTRPGEQAKLEIFRQGKRQTVTATIGEASTPATAAAQGNGPAAKEGSVPSRLGVSVRELAAAERAKLGVEYGVVVIEVERPGLALRPGDVILAVNQSRFRSVEEFQKLLAAQGKGEMVALLVRRGEASVFVPMEVG